MDCRAQIDCEKFLAFGVSEKMLSDFKIETHKNSANIELFFRDKQIASFEKTNQKFLIKEVYNDEYLILSFYTNIGAAGPELMKRESLYILPLLKNEIAIFYVALEIPINLTFSNQTLKYHNNSKNKIYAIQNINQGVIELLSNHGEKTIFNGKEIPYPFIF